MHPILAVTFLSPMIWSSGILLRLSPSYYTGHYIQTNIPGHYATVLFLDALLDTHEVWGINLITLYTWHNKFQAIGLMLCELCWNIPISFSKSIILYESIFFSIYVFSWGMILHFTLPPPLPPLIYIFFYISIFNYIFIKIYIYIYI